jgi:hypothetical protein
VANALQHLSSALRSAAVAGAQRFFAEFAPDQYGRFQRQER